MLPFADVDVQAVLATGEPRSMGYRVPPGLDPEDLARGISRDVGSLQTLRVTYRTPGRQMHFEYDSVLISRLEEDK